MTKQTSPTSPPPDLAPSSTAPAEPLAPPAGENGAEAGPLEGVATTATALPTEALSPAQADAAPLEVELFDPPPQGPRQHRVVGPGSVVAGGQIRLAGYVGRFSGEEVVSLGEALEPVAG